MASRMKEDEKNERIIRNLLKLTDNRRCINCNSLGPQYVCTNFSTFVCTTCSGIHREFTHRVKSVSMAKFTPQEVSALQGGGNASAREIYLKELDPQRNSFPDSSNIDRLRDFIKHVYVDRRYTGERNMEKPPRAKTGETEDSNGNRRIDTYQGGSRSPPYDDTSERRYGDRSSSGGRSPSYDQDNRQSSDYKRSPAREVVNDWRRDDRFGNSRRPEERSSDGGSKLEIRSPDRKNNSGISSPPVVRPVRDILGDNVSPLRVIEPPKATVGRSTDGRAPTQRTTSSSSLASSDGNPSEIKAEASFIDFDSIPEPPTVNVQQTQVAADASSVPLATSSSNDWANFDSLPEVKTTTPASNSLESLLSGLSVPASSSGPSPPPVALSSFQSTGIQASSFGSSFGGIATPSVIPTGGAPVSSFAPAPSNAPTGGQWPTMMNPHQQTLFPGGIEHPVSGGSSSKSWNPLMQNSHGPPGASTAQVGLAETVPAIGASSGFTMDGNSGGRKALPEDLFAMNYSYSPSPVSGWYSGAPSPYAARVPMHYNTPMVANFQAMPGSTNFQAMPASTNFQPMPTSTNPFDVNEPSPVQASAFPSMASLHGALPKTANPSGLMHTPNYGASSYAPPAPAQTQTYAPTIPSSSFMGQEMAGGSMAPRPQGLPGFGFGFGFDDSAFASLNPNPQAGGLHAAAAAAHPASSNFSSSSGNPFG